MQATERTSLFTDLTEQESETVSGAYYGGYYYYPSYYSPCYYYGGYGGYGGSSGGYGGGSVTQTTNVNVVIED